ncbi:MAG: DNA modification methylase [Gammaproteobacteria bacterium]|nr:DNA modification methylase [Gammaproteobacteria bacterium]
MASKPTTRRIKIEDLIEDPDNARTRGDNAKGVLAASLEKFGAARSIVVDKDGKVRAGNGTVEAAKAAGIKEVLIVEGDGSTLVAVRRSDWSDKQALAYALTDNHSSDLSEWNGEKLMEGLTEIVGDDPLQGLGDWSENFGFDLGELRKISVKGHTRVVGDDTPDPPKNPVTKLGDVWELGGHRVVCGDSAEIVAPDSVGCVVVDPEWDRPEAEILWKATTVLAFTDCRRVGDVIRRYGSPTWMFVWDCISSWYCRNRPLARGKLCAWYGDITTYDFDGSHYGEPGESKTVSNTRGTYEFVPDPRGKHLSDVFAFPITKREEQHSHAKPLDWVRMLIANTSSGDIHDPFLGSGTTLLAAEQLGRKCFGVELSPAYVDVAVQRWEELSGHKAKRITA